MQWLQATVYEYAERKAAVDWHHLFHSSPVFVPYYLAYLASSGRLGGWAIRPTCLLSHKKCNNILEEPCSSARAALMEKDRELVFWITCI